MAVLFFDPSTYLVFIIILFLFEIVLFDITNFKTYFTSIYMANKGTPLNKALTQWEEKHGKSAAEAEEIKLVFLVINLTLRILQSINYKLVF